MDASAIEAIRNQAIQAAKAFDFTNERVPAVIIDGNVVSIEPLTGARGYFRGQFQTTNLSAFAEYVKAHGGHGFIDAKQFAARVFHNLGDEAEPGAADWLSTLKLEPTAAYHNLCDIEGVAMLQKSMAEWLEDWAPFLATLEAAGDDTNPSAVSAGIHSIRNLNIKATRDTTHTDKDYGASRSSMEDIEASSKGGMPFGFLFTTEPFAGFKPRDITLRLSVITGDEPRLKLRTVGAERLRESVAEEFRDLLVESIGDAATMTIGTFTP